MFKSAPVFRPVGLILALAIVLAISATARPPDNRAVSDRGAQTVDNTTYIAANRLFMFVTNHGNFGRDLAGVFGNDYGTYYPYTTIADIENGLTKSPLYAGGLWLGGVDAASGDTLIAVSEYSSEYVPGPMAGGTYQPDHPDFRVYKLYGDSLAGNPNDDYLNWPTDQGAPVYGPGFSLSGGDQFAWCAYNDADPDQHDNNNGETDPLGIEVHQSVWARDNVSGPDAHSVFLRFKLINKGGKTLNDFLIGFWLDPDLGSSGDDLIGCDSLDEIMFCYNANDFDDDYDGSIPPLRVPAVGAKLLEGPIVPSPGETGTVDGLPVDNHRNLGLYSIIYYINGMDPDYYWETYQYMHGLQAKEPGAPPYEYMGNETRFWASGDPVTGLGDLDPEGDDKRMMATLEPFDFLPNDTQQVVFTLAVGQAGDRLSSLSFLRAYLNAGSLPTDVDDDHSDLLPDDFRVNQNYPNPFNPSTTIAYSLPERADVEVVIFNALGQRVRTLDEGVQSAGEHTAVWNGVDESGHAVATGVYFYRVRAGDNVSTKKMLLLK